MATERQPAPEYLIAKAVEGRRREFITARRCARAALRAFGYPDAPVRPGPKREPQWPAGMIGSITHCAGYRAAAVARTTDVHQHRGLVLTAVLAD